MNNSILLLEIIIKQTIYLNNISCIFVRNYKPIHPMKKVLLISLSLFLLQCKKEGINKTELKSTSEVNFDGITKRDINGVIIDSSSIDTTDWRFDDQWNQLEKSFFTNLNDSTCNASNENTPITLYPNPTKGLVSISSTLDSVVLVDKSFSNLFKGHNVKTIDLSEFSGDTLRMYYITKKGNCILNGHGDIIIE